MQISLYSFAVILIFSCFSSVFEITDTEVAVVCQYL
jgi:hypothetical protein